MLNRDSASLWRARDLYNEAIERDPAVAAALAGLSSAYGTFGEHGHMPAPDAFKLADAAAREGDCARSAVGGRDREHRVLPSNAFL